MSITIGTQVCGYNFPNSLKSQSQVFQTEIAL
jgi:hypothetical protein